MPACEAGDFCVESGRNRAAALGANATVFLASAGVMLIELVAGRIVSRHLGMSLYTWTGVIGVIMAGISLGNYLGGRIADRRGPERSLGPVFLLAALACAAILPLNSLAGGLEALRGLSWPARIFTHVALVFFAPAAVLGVISPLVAKAAIAARDRAGSAVGGVFAWGTAGSILGTFAAGFVLVPLFSASSILFVSAGTMAALGAAYWWVSRRAGPAGALAEPETAAPAAGPSPGFWAAAVATVLASNTAFMVYEMGVSRVVSMEFGSSIYTWTTVIGVVLAGISLGNWAGGRLADRRRSPAVLSAIFAASGAAVTLALALNLAASWLRMNIFPLAMLSWPVQIVLHTVLAFFPPCVFIGLVSPVVVRRLLDAGAPPGRAVGVIYAWGAVGGIAGTFAAGYALVPWAGALPVISGTAAALALVALAWRPGPVSGAALALTGLVFLGAVLPVPVAAGLGELAGSRLRTPDNCVYEDESRYSRIVVRQSPNNPDIRNMFLDKLLHSQKDMSAPARLLYDYEKVYEGITNKCFPPPAPLRVLVLGGGGYAMPHYFELVRPGSRVVVAEIDPAVTEAAHAAFGLPRDTSIEIHNSDARTVVSDLLAAGERRAFDVIQGDSFNDYTVPYHLTTVEFTRMVSELLDDNGVYMINFIDHLRHGRFLASLVKTCSEVFPHVYVLNTKWPADVRDTFILVNAKKPLMLSDLPLRLQAAFNYRGVLLTPEMLREIEPGGVLLTDDYAPVENLLAPVVQTRNSDPMDMHLDFALRLAARGKTARAMRHACRALAINPDRPNPQDMVFWLLKTPEHAAAARAELDAAVRDGILDGKTGALVLRAADAMAAPPNPPAIFVR